MVSRSTTEKEAAEKEKTRVKAQLEQPINPNEVFALGLHLDRLYRTAHSLTERAPRIRKIHGTEVHDPRLNWIDKSVEHAQDLFDRITPDVTYGENATDHPDIRLPPGLRFQRHGIQDKLRATTSALALTERIRTNKITEEAMKEKATKIRNDALFVLARLTGINEHLGIAIKPMNIPVGHFIQLINTHVHETNNEREHLGAQPIDLEFKPNGLTHVPLGAVFGFIEAFSNANKATKNTKHPRVAVELRHSGEHDFVIVGNNGKTLTKTAAKKLTNSIINEHTVKSGFKVDPTIAIGSGTILPLVARVLGKVGGRVRIQPGLTIGSQSSTHGATTVMSYPKLKA